jgi:glycosyltransferase involved in cell wall biosynthesis
VLGLSLQRPTHGQRPTNGRQGPLALVHDYLLVMRGAERTFAAMADCWPEAPIYTSLYAAEGTSGAFDGRAVYTSRLQALRPSQRNFRRLLPLYPGAIESLPVDEHRVVVSSSSAFAHGVLPGEGSVHVCFCHSPFRYVWHERETALREVPRALRPLMERILQRIQRWDVAASRRVTRYVAGSELVRERIGDFYGREATVIHPPVDVDRFSPDGVAEDFFLVVCELVRHKRVDVALTAARRAGMPIKVVGTGPDLERLRTLFGSSAEFLGRVPDAELDLLYGKALALVVPNVEEFGIAAVEAQAAGRPVIAPKAGGTKETVVDGETGVLVENPSVEELASAMRYVDYCSFSRTAIRKNAERFSRARFAQRFTAEVTAAVCSAGAQVPLASVV